MDQRDITGELQSPDKGKWTCGQIAARRGVKEVGLSAAEIARHLGVATASITRAIAMMEG